LVSSINIKYTEAITFIEKEVLIWEKQLKDGERIDLGDAGFLYVQNNQLVLEQNREVNLLLQAFGLSPVNLLNVKDVQINKDDDKILVKPVFTEKSYKQSLRVEPVRENKPVVHASKRKTSIDKKAESTPTYQLKADEIESEVKQEPDGKIISISEGKRKPKNYKYALAAAVVLPALFYSYWIPMKTDFLHTHAIQVSDFNPFSKQKDRVYEMRQADFMIDAPVSLKSWEELTSGLPENVMVYNLELNEETYIPVQLKDEVTSDLSSELQSKAYELIAGCFSVKKNAEKLIDDLNQKGYQARILDQSKGLYRVTAATYNSKREAETALESLRSNGFSGWILKP
jgi:hypothetical protein